MDNKLTISEIQRACTGVRRKERKGEGCPCLKKNAKLEGRVPRLRSGVASESVLCCAR